MRRKEQTAFALLVRVGQSIGGSGGSIGGDMVAMVVTVRSASQNVGMVVWWFRDEI